MLHATKKKIRTLEIMYCLLEAAVVELQSYLVECLYDELPAGI